MASRFSGTRSQEEQEIDEENEKDSVPAVSGPATITRLPETDDNAKWFDSGYVPPASRSTEVANWAVLEAKNYDGLRHLDVDHAKLYLQHELPEGYQIIKRIGEGTFGCCFLVEKKLQRVAPMRGNISRTHADTEQVTSIIDADMGGKIREAKIMVNDLYHDPCSYTWQISEDDGRCLQMVLKVVLGNITPRHPVRFYKSCSEFTLMISHKALPLELVNLKFIIGILKYHHETYQEVHGDLHPGNMMYFPKDVTKKMWWLDLCPNRRDSGWERWHHASHIVQAALDFEDHWFSMGDEQVTSIIDADMGGKIGEAKIMVNDLYHDPRNYTWQISDDLIGLMNWVVRKHGYSLCSHPERGFVYGITLDHLKILYKHITDTYEGLDSKYIFTSIFASKESFEIKLEEGECYLDELLEGQFLKFQKFKGSYSLGPSEDVATSCVKMITPTVVQAVPMFQKDVCEAFRKLTSSQEFLCTAKEVLTLLVDPNLHGGVIFLIVDKAHKDKLQIRPLDEGALTQLCRQHAVNLHDPSFKHILGSFCAHSDTDRWEEALLLRLANDLERGSQNDGPTLVSLKNQPKDGAFVFSHKGTVLAAASHLEHTAPHLELRKVDGTCVGTRHAASLGAAEWMRCENILGAVFVKSDAGSVHVLIPDHDQDLPRIALVHVNGE